jgi:hypothetical protein
LFSSLTTLRVGYTPRLLRSCLLPFWISWYFLIFSYLNPLSYVDSLWKRFFETMLSTH